MKSEVEATRKMVIIAGDGDMPHTSNAVEKMASQDHGVRIKGAGI
jgi:hypothetical protein